MSKAATKSARTPRRPHAADDAPGRAIEIPTADEVRRLVAACSRSAATGARNAALISTVYAGGLRIGEALALRVDHLDLETGRLQVVRGKRTRTPQKAAGGSKAGITKGTRRRHAGRVVGLDPGTCGLIEQWLKKRSKWTESPYLFCTLDGDRLADNYCRAALARIAKHAGLKKRTHWHALRHARAVALVKAGAPLNEIQSALGHTNLAVTSRYLDHVAASDVVDRMRGMTWLDAGNAT